MGVSRLSLGVENFDDTSWKSTDGHHSKEIARAYGYAGRSGFRRSHRPDRRMVEETEANWKECVRKTIELSPDSVTIYRWRSPTTRHLPEDEG